MTDPVYFYLPQAFYVIFLAWPIQINSYKYLFKQTQLYHGSKNGIVDRLFLTFVPFLINIMEIKVETYFCQWY